MGRYGKTLRAVVGEITQSSDRSSLFWWLTEHHDEIAGAAVGKRLQWGALCTRFAEAGLTDLTGKSPTPNTAKVTWQRVKRAVAQARQLQAAEAAKPKRVGATPPSRISRNWRPQEVTPPSAGLPSLTPPALATAAGGAGTDLTTAEGAEKARQFEEAFQAYLKEYKIVVPPGSSPQVWEQFRSAFRQFNHRDRFLRLG